MFFYFECLIRGRPADLFCYVCTWSIHSKGLWDTKDFFEVALHHCTHMHNKKSLFPEKYGELFHKCDARIEFYALPIRKGDKLDS